MKNRKHFWSRDIVILLLASACIALSVVLVLARPIYLIPVVAFVCVVTLLLFLFIHQIRHVLRRLFGGKNLAESEAFKGLYDFSVPVIAVMDQRVVWYNQTFQSQFAQGVDFGLVPVGKMVPGLDFKLAGRPSGQDLKIGHARYTAFASPVQAEQKLYLLFFIEDTHLKTYSEEYVATRPAVLYFIIDTYDEILKEMKESERAIIISNIDMALEKFIGYSSGFLRRISSSRYIAIVEERHIAAMIAQRFTILDDVRKLGHDSSTVTLSIGVGRMGNTLKDCEEMAKQALDMALGRGGDQAAVKTADGYEFYGGVSRSVEKRTKVKSRIVAAAIKDLLVHYERVLIMGHKNSDMDSLGAAVGMLCFCRLCKKPAAIVIQQESSMSENLLELLDKNGYGEDLLSPSEAMALTGPKTLVVIVDTHIGYMLESQEVYKSCGGTVVIDHHRRMVGYIEDALVFYHEPYASSASELVTELLQYVSDDKDNKPLPVEAEALLAGIMLDTRIFSLHVGVRTFEASAYLRRLGAQTETVKKLFTSSMDNYLYRSHLVSEAKMYKGCAVSFSDKVPLECEVVAPQAANELLTIDNVDASFVGIKHGDEIRISARSMGELNVQLVMEKIGGGGHLTMAGAQLKGVTIEQAKEQLLKAISVYFEERTHVK